MSDSKIIGTPLSQLRDNDTVKEVIQKIATNQQSLYTQMMEIVKFFNAVYSPERDKDTVFTTVINSASIIRVTVKNGVIYIAYNGADGKRNIIKFKLTDIDYTIPEDVIKGTGIIELVAYTTDREANPLPDDASENDYAFADDDIYQFKDNEWVRTSITDIYAIYDNVLYHFLDGDMREVITIPTTPTQPSTTTSGIKMLRYVGDATQVEAELLTDDLIYDTATDAFYKYDGEKLVEQSDQDPNTLYYTSEPSENLYRLDGTDNKLKAIFTNKTTDTTEVSKVDNLSSKIDQIWNYLNNKEQQEAQQQEPQVLTGYEPKAFNRNFNPVVANDGELNINITRNGKKVTLEENVEEITVQDVRLAYQAIGITPFDQDLPIIDEGDAIPAEGYYILTGEKAGFEWLSENDYSTTSVIEPTKTVSEHNAALFLEIIKASGTYERCLGLRLSKVYRMGVISNTGNYVTVEKDFVIDGTVNDEAVGGFSVVKYTNGAASTTTYSEFFKTSHSLIFRNANFESCSAYNSFVVDTTNGIDQVIISGCTFRDVFTISGRPQNEAIIEFTRELRTEQVYDSSSNKYVNRSDSAYSPFESDNSTMLSEERCVNYMVFDSNKIYAGDAISGVVRTNKLCLIIENEFYNSTFTYVRLGSSGTYDSQLTYASSPAWIVGNRFVGAETIVRRKTAAGDLYWCAALIERRAVYMLHNDIHNFISAMGAGGSKATYDLYGNVTNVYFCNNNVKNLLRLSRYRTNVGTLKAKGSDIPAIFSSTHKKANRYYKNNTYTVDRDYVLTLWNNRTQEEQDFDRLKDATYGTSSVAFDDYLCLGLGYSTTDVNEEIVFSNNTINYPRIEGSGYLASSTFKINNNVFTGIDGGKIKFGWKLGENDYPYLFNLASDKLVEIKGNTFDFDDSSKTIPLVTFRNYLNDKAETPTVNATIDVTGNTLPTDFSLLGLHNQGAVGKASAWNEHVVLPNRDINTIKEVSVLPDIEATGFKVQLTGSDTVYVCKGGMINSTSMYIGTNVGTDDDPTYLGYTFNNEVYKLQFSSIEYINIVLNGYAETVVDLRNMINNFLVDNGYYTNKAGLSSNRSRLFIRSKKAGSFAMPKSKADATSLAGGKAYIYFQASYGNVSGLEWYPTYGATLNWELTSGDTQSTEPEYNTVSDLDIMPKNATVGTRYQVASNDPNEAGIYECTDAGSPCVVDFTVGMYNGGNKAVDTTCVFTNKVVEVPINDSETITFALNGEYSPLQIINAFRDAAKAAFYDNPHGTKYTGTDGVKRGAIYTVYSSTTCRADIVIYAKNNGSCEWDDYGTPLKAKADAVNDTNRNVNGKLAYMTLNESGPEVLLCRKNTAGGVYADDLTDGTDAVWTKIDNIGREGGSGTQVVE